MSKKQRPFDMEDCAFYTECASRMASALHEALACGESPPEYYANAAFGISLFLNYISNDAGNAAEAEARCGRHYTSLPGNDR